MSSAGLLVFGVKRLRTRLRTERIERPLIEFRRESFGRRRKSVRYDASSEAMGLEMPRTAPEEERWDQRIPLLGMFLGSWFSCCFLRARRRRHVVIRRARTAPKTAPGKKPAATAPLGNAEHDEGSAAAAAVERGVTAVPRDVELEVGELEAEVVPFFDVLLSKRQKVSWQV